MQREIKWRFPTAEEASALIHRAIRSGHATEAEFKELLAIPTDGNERQKRRLVELLKKFGIGENVPADPVGDGLIQIWPPPKDEPKLWEEVKRETVNGVTSIELKFIGPARRKRSKPVQRKE
jgi:hypothetical protein